MNNELVAQFEAVAKAAVETATLRMRCVELVTEYSDTEHRLAQAKALYRWICGEPT
jgi:hypothetical protein